MYVPIIVRARLVQDMVAPYERRVRGRLVSGLVALSLNPPRGNNKPFSFGATTTSPNVVIHLKNNYVLKVKCVYSFV